MTVIAVRFAWHMSFNGVLRWWHRHHEFDPPRPMLRPTIGSGLVISWAGMRGIVTLAGAMALPKRFPQRDLIMMVAFGVSLGTLVLHGLTLKPLLRALRLRDDDPVGREVDTGRRTAYRAALASIGNSPSPAAALVRNKFETLLAYREEARGVSSAQAQRFLYRQALQAARQALLTMRAADEIGDDAFHLVEQELDWFEMALGDLRGNEEERGS